VQSIEETTFCGHKTPLFGKCYPQIYFGGRKHLHTLSRPKPFPSVID